MREKLHTLKRVRVRQSWNKYNLYNLTRQQRPNTRSRTFFQQKFAAKQETRKYHGEHMTKRAWQSIFRHSLKAVMPMSSQALARFDGSEQALGRGSGLEGGRNSKFASIPFMHQMFAPMERRLDIAVFRAMFASSARQARQFVVHGFVKVNGKKMKYPSYMLNPGDIFSVDPERVLFATGAPKNKPKVSKKSAAKTEGESSEASEKAEVEAKEEPAQAEAKPLRIQIKCKEESAEEAETGDAEVESKPSMNKPSGTEEDPTNPLDLSKPYATPWRPRDYMSPFAFIPRYLEVNHNICHAVYLRHPMARPGSSEVPTPFTHETLQLAYNWFLRRR
ncbi:hypothetical protein RUND412_004613 [Rhizina undulata]